MLICPQLLLVEGGTELLSRSFIGSQKAVGLWVNRFDIVTCPVANSEEVNKSSPITISGCLASCRSASMSPFPCRVCSTSSSRQHRHVGLPLMYTRKGHGRFNDWI
ncbi:hypothetical protein PoB_006542600 [Plakobranchus ocellatus]|uniref:Uncharacterized protein n=1 Tax=Plakobranchus ocellatus TaxID=259542 RepID=A0AAV4D405_9GAST|nr:hypothetical protein PoB_006542600 [Plakobranchus ocellatus]